MRPNADLSPLLDDTGGESPPPLRAAIRPQYEERLRPGACRQGDLQCAVLIGGASGEQVVSDPTGVNPQALLIQAEATRLGKFPGSGIVWSQRWPELAQGRLRVFL